MQRFSDSVVTSRAVLTQNVTQTLLYVHTTLMSRWVWMVRLVFLIIKTFIVQLANAPKHDS